MLLRHALYLPLTPRPPGRSLGGGNAALVSIYIATALLSEILTNNAAGAIMYPIAAMLGDELGVGVRQMSVAVMLGASAGFTNPFRCEGRPFASCE